MKKSAALALIKERLPVLAVAAVIIITAIIVPRLIMQPPSAPAQRPAQQPAADIPRFRSECIRKMQAGSPPPSCASAEAIKQAYNLDIWMLLDEDKSKLLTTARRIARGDLMTDEEYEQCLDEGNCLPVPRLSGKKNPDSPEGIAIRKQFWHLVDNNRLTPQVCAQLDLCQALLKAGIITEAHMERL